MVKSLSTIRVQEAPFDVAAEMAALAGPPFGTSDVENRRADIGGIGCFVGMVRGTSAGRRISAMTLEHYPAMTEPALRSVVQKAQARWVLLGCTVIHRVGRLRPGEGIVLVLTASAHRQAALDATAFLIDYLKTSAPFWKKESFVDGGEAWVEARESDASAVARWQGFQRTGSREEKQPDP